jgi:hypothetical protein
MDRARFTCHIAPSTTAMRNPQKEHYVVAYLVLFMADVIVVRSIYICTCKFVTTQTGNGPEPWQCHRQSAVGSDNVSEKICV